MYISCKRDMSSIKEICYIKVDIFFLITFMYWQNIESYCSSVISGYMIQKLYIILILRIIFLYATPP